MTDAERWAYLAEGNAKQARKRVAAKVLVRDTVGRVLLVNPTYKDHWDLPGGMAEANEPPRAAAEFVAPDVAAHRLRHDMADRLRRALRALTAATTDYGERS